MSTNAEHLKTALVFPKRVCIVDRHPLRARASPMREARALVASGIDTWVLCPRDAGGVAPAVVDRVHIRYRGTGSFDRRSAAENALYGHRVSAGLFTLHLARRCRVVQVNLSCAWLVLVVIAARLLGARVVTYMVEPLVEKLACTHVGPRHKALIAAASAACALAHRMADRVVVSTREMRDRMGSQGQNLHKIAVVLDLPEKSAGDTSASRPTLDRMSGLKKEERRRGVFRIVTRAHAGLFGMDQLMQALATAAQDLAGVELHVLTAADSAPVMRLATRFNVQDRVHVIEPATDTERLKEILAADVAVVPARGSAYSALVIARDIFEFAAQDKPIITARLPAVASYFPPEGLVFFEPDNPQDLADRIYHVFAHPEESGRCVDKMRETLESYTWEREQKKYLHVFQQS